MESSNNYKSISFQLFGNFSKSTGTCTCGDDQLCWGKFDSSTRGPYVDLSDERGKRGRGTAAVGKRKPKWRMRKTAKGREARGRPPKVSTRCLICYAELMGGEKPKGGDTAEQLEEKVREVFPIFVNLLLTTTDQDPIPEANLEEGKENKLKTETMKLSTSKQIKSYPFLCRVCVAAARQFVRGYHAMKKLEEQVSEMRAKFLNALKLSAMLAAAKSTEVDLESASKPAKIVIESVEYLRMCLLRGGPLPEVTEEGRRKRRLISKSVRADVAEVLSDIISTIEDIEEASRMKTNEEKPAEVKTYNISECHRDQNEAAAEAANSDDIQSGPEESNTEFCPDDDEFTWDEEPFNESAVTNLEVEGQTSMFQKLSGEEHSIEVAKSSDGGNVKVAQTTGGNGDMDVSLKNRGANEADQEKQPEPSSSKVLQEYQKKLKNKKKSSGKRKRQSRTRPNKPGIRVPDKVPIRLRTNPARAKRYYEMRAKNPQLTQREFYRLDVKPKIFGPLTKEEAAKQEARKVRWKEYKKRMQTMHPGITKEQYKEMRLKKAAEKTKCSKDGLPGRSGPRGYRVITPVKEVEGEDGRTRYFYKDVEILKREEDGFFTCCACSCEEKIVYKSIHVLKTHINKHHIDVSNGYECEVCGRKFYYHNQLQTHLKSSHKIGDSQYQCDICGQVFANRTSRGQHKKIVHDGIKPHVCGHCGKAFGVLKDMRLHERRHTGERPYICHVCADAFYDKQTLKKHVRRKHPEAVEDMPPASNSNQERRIHLMANMKLETSMNEIEDEQDTASATFDLDPLGDL